MVVVGDGSMTIFERLDQLNISYQVIEHEPIATIEEAKKVSNQIDGVGCKCLFLKDKHKHYYLVLMNENNRMDLKSFSKIVGCSRLSFAHEEELEQILHLKPGSVTPLGIIHDQDNVVSIWIEQALEREKVLVHPNCNTMTLSIEMKDLLLFITHENHQYHFFH